MAPRKQVKKQQKPAKKLASTFAELRKAKQKELFARIKLRDLQAKEKTTLEYLLKKRAEEEERGKARATKEQEAQIVAIKNLRKSQPFTPFQDFRRLIQNQYKLDIGQNEILTQPELDAARQEAQRQTERQTALTTAQQRAMVQDLARVAEEQQRKLQEARVISQAQQAEARRRQQRPEAIVQQLEPTETQKRTEALGAFTRQQEAKQEAKRRRKLIGEIGKTMEYLNDIGQKSEEELNSFLEKYDQIEKAKPKSTKLKKLLVKIRQLEEEKARLDAVLVPALGLLDRNKIIADGARPLADLQQIPQELRDILGLDNVGAIVKGKREIARNIDDIVKGVVPAGAPPAGAAGAPPAGAAGAPPAGAPAGAPPAGAPPAGAPPAGAPPANVVAVNPAANANNANALANAAPAVVANINAQPAGQGLMRHFAIHPSHITETKDSYKLSGKGLKHAKMLFKYLPNHAPAIVAFSMLNKARNKLHKLDKKKKKIKGGFLDDLKDQLEDTVMNYGQQKLTDFGNKAAAVVNNLASNVEDKMGDAVGSMILEAL